MMSSNSHISVLLQPAIDALAIKADGIYIDGTFGRGGHSAAILAQLGDSGRLIAIDRDSAAVAVAHEKFAGDARFSIHHAAFTELETIANAAGVAGQVDGILLDIGLSSPQLDTPERGFSFLHDGPLDMRMDPSQGQSAADWLAKAKAAEIADVLKTYGEERFAKRIANAIVQEGQQRPITTTGRLAEIVKAANPKWEKHKHPATRAFQAIRIFINDELGELRSVLDQSLRVLGTGGRLAVISFHSLEDRIVKRFMRKHSQGELPVGLPVTDEQLGAQLKLIGKATKPSAEELDVNPRARSAVLRVGEKIR